MPDAHNIDTHTPATLQVFDLRRWEEHRSTQRYTRYMDRLLTSRIARGLLGPITYVASLCISVGTYHTLVDQQFIRDLLPEVCVGGVGVWAGDGQGSG
jgi:hypothetical protein